ncbi:hypothetical protein E2I00_001535 [Balaenoptera physalus]
MLERR